MVDEKKAGIELNRSHLSSPNTQLWLGGLAAHQLQTMGTVTLFLGEDGKVRVANPVHVYLGPEAMVDDESSGQVPRVRWLRPIVGEAKPQMAAWKDGMLWEVEIDDELDG